MIAQAAGPQKPRAPLLLPNPCNENTFILCLLSILPSSNGPSAGSLPRYLACISFPDSLPHYSKSHLLCRLLCCTQYHLNPVLIPRCFSPPTSQNSSAGQGPWPSSFAWERVQAGSRDSSGEFSHFLHQVFFAAWAKSGQRA